MLDRRFRIIDMDGDDGAFMPWFMLWGFVMCGVRLEL